MSAARLVDDAVAEVERMLGVVLGSPFDLYEPGEFVLLTDANTRGRELTDRLAADGWDVSHTFASSQRQSRALKKAFFLGGKRLRATTAHSFKGWEASAIVVCIARGNTQKALSLLYSAMTRLKADRRGSYLTVVNAESRLARYGRTWP